MTPEQLLGEVEDLLRTMPSRVVFIQSPADVVEWSGRASAVMELVGSTLSVQFFSAMQGVNGSRHIQDASLVVIPRLLHQARFTLRMKTVGPISTAVGAGHLFDYFDEVRQIIEGATGDLLFVDPFLDAEFVARYLPHVKEGVVIRLLTRKGVDKLLPAVDVFSEQHGARIQVRGSGDLHDRFVIVDASAAYQSGASFKDGAKRSPTTLSQITDAFRPLHHQYETLWHTAQVHRD